MTSEHFGGRVMASFSGARYWLIIVCSSLSLPLIELFLPRLSPTRFWVEGVYKLLYLAPLSLCWWAGVSNRWTMTVRAASMGRFRAVAGSRLPGICGVPGSFVPKRSGHLGTVSVLGHRHLLDWDRGDIYDAVRPHNPVS